ncbi:30S ribosomal protein S8 [Candidatus Peregrinibacteria bacterium]|nr:30S ribosomal protein S8 [Candidatus Peregrinibacteria bacterium]
MNTDPIADLLTRIRNASRAQHKAVRTPASKMKYAIAGILSRKGFVGEVKKVKNGKFEDIEITLHKAQKDIHLTRKSKPGQRLYCDASSIRSVQNGYGIGIISTSQGIMAADEAKEKGIGGEYVCEVY